VIRWDHHCTVINQCIGVRNHRAFLFTLTLGWINFAWMFVFGLWDICAFDLSKGISKLNHNEKKMAILTISLDVTVISLILIKLLTFVMCKRRVSHGRKVLWIIIEIFVVQALYMVNWRNWALNI
jgi:hypothetical protein